MLVDRLKEARRLLLMRLDNIGDVVMLSPALRALRAALPQAHITLLTSPAGAQVAPLLPWVDDVWVRRVVWQDASSSMPLDPGREQDLVRALALGDFSAAFIFTSFSQSPYPPAYACYLAGIPVRIGESKEFGGSVLSHWFAAPPDETHQVDRNLFLLESAGLPVTRRDLELRLPGQARRKADQVLAEAGVDPQRPFLAVAPGASCPARTYDPARMAEVTRRLVEETGMPAVVLGSPRDASVAEAVASASRGRPPVTCLAARTSVPELAAILSRARLLVANDSGPMHVADAFRRPMVILFSGTDLEDQWRPRAAPARLLRRPTFCSPCYRFECAYDMECLQIPPQEVVTNALAVLATAEVESKVAG